jgi:hypothetical protein
MSDISIISRLVNGYNRNVDLAQNSLVVGSIKIGSTSPVEITKAIAAKLLLIQAAADADGTFDTRYTRITELASTANGKGASLVGVEDAAGNFTGTNVEAVLAELFAAAGTGAADDVTYDPTASGLTATNVQDAIDEVESRLDATEIVANAAIPLAQKGANNGVATLDGGGKVPVSQLPNAVMTYEGMWDASTNTPTLANGTGNAGQVYRVSAPGSVDFGAGNIEFAVGDYVIYSGSVWEKSDGTDAVNSVNGQQGIVVLNTSNIAENTNLYFTDERAQDAVGSILADSSTIDFTYSDATPSITADVKDNSIGNAKLTTGVADQDTITGGNGSALQVVKAPKIQTAEVAGEALSSGAITAMRFGRAADAGFVAGRMYLADSDSSVSDNFDVIGLCKPASAIAAGDPIQVVSNGDFIATAHGFTIGEPLFLTSAGVISNTPPTPAVGTATVKVGTVKDANTIRVNIQIMNGG